MFFFKNDNIVFEIAKPNNTLSSFSIIASKNFEACFIVSFLEALRKNPFLKYHMGFVVITSDFREEMYPFSLKLIFFSLPQLWWYSFQKSFVILLSQNIFERRCYLLDCYCHKYFLKWNVSKSVILKRHIYFSEIKLTFYQLGSTKVKGSLYAICLWKAGKIH